MRTIRFARGVVILVGVVVAIVVAAGLARPAGAQVSDSAIEAAARGALENFIDAWNTGDNNELRKTMNFPFVSLFGGGAAVAMAPEDFVTDFDAMRQRNDWVRSDFDFDRFEMLAAGPDKAHVAIDFRRYNSSGEAYMQGRVFYILTRQEEREQDEKWGMQMRTGLGAALSGAQRTSTVEAARGAVLDFFTAFNAGDVDGVSEPLHYPHVFMAGGGVRAAQDARSPSVRPNFEGMLENQGWHMSSIDSLEASFVSADKVHLDLVFSRWHPDGTRYLTIPALWILTRVDDVDDQWGIQLRSLLPPTFSSTREP